MHLKSDLSVFVSVLLSMVLSSCVVGLLEFHIVYASPYMNIGVDVAYNMITGDSYPNLTILDVRTQSEYDGGHIYGAVWIPYTELQARIDELTGHENHEIIVYCKSGGRSAIASETLDSNNFTKVYNMLGGISAWQSSGYPVWIATVHNVNTTFNYDTIQAAIKAPQTLDGHTILVDEGTYHENVVVNKTISLIGENRSTAVIDGDGTGNVVLFEGVNDVTVTGFTVRNGSNGFCMIGSNHTVAENIIVYNTHHGIDLVGSNSCISENTIANNHFGVILGGSSYNVICRNIIMSNEGGINLDENCARNNIIENTLMNNTMGIGIAGNNNTVVENTIEENWSGIEIGGTDNTIYHNNLIENTIQVYLHNSHFNNEWDDRCEGNYWSDYEERYPNAAEIDQSGIWDTPYVIDENNTDHYPLMNPYWLPGDVNHDLKIDIYDVVRITGIYRSQQGDPNWNCHSDIAEPYGIINIYDVVTCTKDYGKEYTP